MENLNLTEREFTADLGLDHKIAEMVSFFNLNALSSPLMIRIHFDVLWTMIADTLYRRFAQDLRRF